MDLYFLNDETAKELNRLNINRLRQLQSQLSKELSLRDGVETKVPPEVLSKVVEKHRQLVQGITLVYQVRTLALSKLTFQLTREVDSIAEFSKLFIEDVCPESCDLKYEYATLDGSAFREFRVKGDKFPDHSLYDLIQAEACLLDNPMGKKLADWRQEVEKHQASCSELIKNYQITEQELIAYLHTASRDLRDA